MYWFVWRPVIEGKCRLHEAEHEYSLVDLWRMNRVLDAVHDAERAAAKKAQQTQ